MVDEALKEHRNRREVWMHEGYFKVQITHDADLTVVPNCVYVPSGTDDLGRRVLTIEDGKIDFHPVGGLQFHARGKAFRWRMKYIRAIWDEHGDPLWVNHDLT